jgi:hypothetical protein
MRMMFLQIENLKKEKLFFKKNQIEIFESKKHNKQNEKFTRKI